MREFYSVEKRAVVRKAGERGSALMIVFVFAVIIAIMLYMELPVAVFEARRQKEQLLIDRGNEYAHAVKLFVRKTGNYPASMEALESTNQVRFLRHRFKDPFTGKDDWRLLHAGPNGILIDSKVQQPTIGQNGANGNPASGQNGATSSSGFGSFGSNASSTSGSTFGNNSGSSTGSNSGSSFGSSSWSSSSNSAPETVVPPLTHRGPAIAAIGSKQGTGSATDPNALPALPPLDSLGQTSGNASTNPGNGNSAGQSLTAGQQTAQNAIPGNASGGLFANTSNPAGSTSGSNTSTGSGLGTISSGGIAGVASRASGHSIKILNDQTNYSLWEFYYDPTKDASKGIASALSTIGATGQQANQQNGSNTNSNSAFGSNSNSAFGSSNSSTTSSPFGGSSNTSSPFGSTSGNTSNNSGVTPGVSPSTTTPQ